MMVNKNKLNRITKRTSVPTINVGMLTVSVSMRSQQK